MRKSVYILVGVTLGLSMMVGACAKKAKQGEKSEMKEERVASTPEAGKEMPGMEEPGMKESESEMKPEDHGMGGLTAVLFDFDQYNIREDQRAVLEANAKWLNANPAVSVSIEGHCDERGTNEYNLALGERRAQSTKRYLATLGVDKKRLSTISYGEERPLCMDKAESCYSRNRRSQFELKK